MVLKNKCHMISLTHYARHTYIWRLYRVLYSMDLYQQISEGILLRFTQKQNVKFPFVLWKIVFCISFIYFLVPFCSIHMRAGPFLLAWYVLLPSKRAPEHLPFLSKTSTGFESGEKLTFRYCKNQKHFIHDCWVTITVSPFKKSVSVCVWGGL